MKYLISGSSGLVGSHLSSFLIRNNCSVSRLVRSGNENAERIRWNPHTGSVSDPELLENMDIAVHLSGENVVGLWTKEKKRRIRESRVNSTRFLVDTFSGLRNPPKCFICASAIGYYGDRGSSVLNENSPADDGFLAEVCIDWENEANRASGMGIRVVNLRIGVVLSKEGGALGMMLKPYKYGLGGVVGSGEQYWSWVSIEDISRIIKYTAENETISGPVNVVSPNPVTNREFSNTLASVLKRPAFLPVPAFLIKFVFGDFGEHALLASTRVVPDKLADNGYQFHHSDLRGALEDLI